MKFTAKELRSIISKGGMWIMVVNKPEMESIFFYLKNEENVDILKMRCETVGDATRAMLLVEAFNTWTIEGIREFMKSHENFPKIEL